MNRRITLELDATSRAVLSAATYLLSDSRIRIVPRLSWDARRPPHGRTLRLEPASLAYPALTLLWGEDRPASPVGLMQQAALGATSAVWWDGQRLDTWRDTARPLPRHALWGKADSARPWALVAPGTSSIDSAELESVTGLSRPQPQLLVPSERAWQDSVWWLPTSRAVRSLLGHVDVVLAPQGPLAWDAARVGVRAIATQGTPEPPTGLAARRLARVVPAALARDRRFWRGIVASLAQGEATETWNTLAWLRLARELAATSHRARLRRWAGQQLGRLHSR